MGTSVAANSTAVTGKTELLPGLRLFDATTLVMGSMIGSGVFIVAADIARQVQSPGLFLVSWIISGFMTISAAISYGELAAMMPKAGGQYVYLREAFSPLFGFLYGWTLFLVIQTGTIAAVAVAFGKFLGVFFPWVSAQNLLIDLGNVNLFGHSTALTVSSQQLIAILVLLFLAGVNVLGVRTGAWVQNVFTVLKVGALVAIIALGIWWGASPHSAYTVSQAGLNDYWKEVHWSLGTLTLVSVALVGPLFSSDAWNNVTFAGSEIINPKRNLPLALFSGTLLVSVLYLACNWIYLRVLPFYGNPHGITILQRGIQYAAEDRVATAAMQVVFGAKGAKLMAAAIIISTFGCINGMTLAGARVYYAMAKHHLFFRSAGTVSSRYHTPTVSLVIQAIWASLLTLSGTYSELLDYVIFAAVLFYILTILGIFRLRQTRPDAPRPYRAWGYPVILALYVLFAGFVEMALLTHKPLRSIAGLLIVGLGIPVYCLWQRGTPIRAEEQS
jgi:APA family basic amino acid/polyamine antiporter